MISCQCGFGFCASDRELGLKIGVLGAGEGAGAEGGVCPSQEVLLTLSSSAGTVLRPKKASVLLRAFTEEIEQLWSASPCQAWERDC